MLRSIRSLCVLTALALATPTLVLAQVPASPVLQASTTGQTVSASWTAVPGATSYRVEAGVTPSLMLVATRSVRSPVSPSRRRKAAITCECLPGTATA
jgi:hypothetical protein